AIIKQALKWREDDHGLKMAGELQEQLDGKGRSNEFEEIVSAMFYAARASDEHCPSRHFLNETLAEIRNGRYFLIYGKGDLTKHANRAMQML
ncbi:hypothetical protein LTR43_012144, partial [Exophiala xenobiotica]